MSRPPANADEIYVVGKQWMWKLQHADGRREINELHLPIGRPVKLVMTSQDVIHDFFVPAFRTKQDVLPGRYTTMWFTPTKPGKYHLFCAQYCGTDHSHDGRLGVCAGAGRNTRAGSRRRPAANLARRPGRADLSHARLQRLPRAQFANPRAAARRDLSGSRCRFPTAPWCMADEQYLRDSILLPNKQIAAGYEALMPTFQNQISEDDLAALLAYLKSLGTAAHTR